MKTVNFTEMKNGTKEDYELLEKFEKKFERQTAERVLNYLSKQTTTLEGYKITRLEHSLQAATRAFKNKESDEMVVATLLHDIGDDLAPMNHSQYAASILRPYVSERTYWIILHHGLFQTYYSAHHLGGDRNARDKFKDHKYYQDTIDFCEKYDIKYPIFQAGMGKTMGTPTTPELVYEVSNAGGVGFLGASGLTLEEIEKSVKEIKKNSRRLAKRQITWFKRDKQINWFILDQEDEIIKFILES